MNYQLLALDLDGTALRNDHNLNPWVRDYVQKIVDKYHVVVVTGRHHTAAKPYYDQLGVTLPIICCNGVYQYNYVNQQVESGTPISPTLANAFLQLAFDYDLKIVMYTDSGMAIWDQDPMPYILPLKQWADSYPIDKRPKIYFVENLVQEQQRAECIWKFVVQGSTDNFNQFLQEELITTHFSGSISGTNRIDLAIKGHSKGRALLDYASNMSLDINRTVAIGDNFNDVSMLSMAGCGVAMLNASEKVQNSADRVTSTDNQGEGLALLLKELFPLK